MPGKFWGNVMTFPCNHSVHSLLHSNSNRKKITGNFSIGLQNKWEYVPQNHGTMFH
jgi:hypothetical protein